MQQQSNMQNKFLIDADIGDDDDLHPADAESGVGMFAIFLALVIIAFILYFAFVRSLMS